MRIEDITGAFAAVNSNKFSTKQQATKEMLPQRINRTNIMTSTALKRYCDHNINNNNSVLNELKFLYTNATSLANKRDDLCSLIDYLKLPHVIMITETWFNINSISKIDKYTLFCKNRDEVRGGGVAIYIRDDICSLEVSDNILSKSSIEGIWCSIKIGTDLILLGCIYRPPHSAREVNIEIFKSLTRAKHLQDSKKYTGLLVAGDLNFSDIDWNNDGGVCRNNGRSSSLEFLNCIDSNFLIQNVHQPTYHKNTLDLVITDDPTRIFEIIIGPPLGSTDKNKLHNTLTWCYNLKDGNQTTISQRPRHIYKKGNYTEISNHLDSCAYNFNNPDVNASYDTLVDLYSNSVLKCIPTKVTKAGQVTKSNPKWFNKDVKYHTSRKYRLHRKLLASPNCGSLLNEYRTACKEVKKAVNSAVQLFESKIVSNCKLNPKPLYNYINCQKTCKESIRSLVDQNGHRVNDGLGKANLLNIQFASVFNEINQSIIPTLPERKTVKCVLNIQLFSVDNIDKALRKINQHKSAGTDGIHQYVLKHSSLGFASILSRIFSESFRQSKVPLKWKEANITPIFKKGPRIIPANYRPISLTAVPCKLMERILRDVMLKHLTDNNLIASEQHGFVLSKSCVTNLLETLDTISNALLKDHRVILIFLDFAKAFDKVCHLSLISKLRSYGFDHYIIGWISDFLLNRKQRVVLGSDYSDWCNVTSGVPQGSVIGPLLFVIYINDMPSITNHILKLFADDSKLIGIIKNAKDIDLIQQDLDALVNWSQKWKMMFNLEKCKRMEISKSNRTSREPPQLSMAIDCSHRHTSSETKLEKDLGVYISNNAKFDHHIKFATNRANVILGQLKRTFRCWSIPTFRTLYTTFVRPHLEYAVQAWSPYRKRDIAALEQVQRRATKIVTSLKNLSYTERLRALNLTTLRDRRTRGDLIQYFKIYKEINIVKWCNDSNIPSSLYSDGPASRIRGERHRLSRQFTKNCDQREHFFVNRVIPSWNELPEHVIASTTVNTFKNRLDSHILKNGLSSLNYKE